MAPAKKAGKQARYQARYVGRFWGVTASTLEAFRGISRGKDRAAAFYLLSTMLLESRWNFHNPGADFTMSRRQIQNATGRKIEHAEEAPAWGHTEIARYIEVLSSAGILNIKRNTGRPSVYWLNCDALGLIRKGDRSKKKSKRPYIGTFWGMTSALRRNITERIPEGEAAKGYRGKQRSKCLWLLANVLVHSNWDPKRPGDPFQMSVRDLASLVGWDVKTVAKHRNMLIKAGFLEVDFPGGRGFAATYTLNLGLAGITVPAENQVKKIFDDGEAKKKS